MDNLRHFAHGVFKKAAETVTGPLKNSQFEEKRVLTPQEFVEAGDYLVRACPTWSWESGDPKKRRSYFPADKQFLVTRNVPCMKRASELEQYNPNSEFALGGDEEGWTATHQQPGQAASAGQQAQQQPGAALQQGPQGGAAGGGDDDIPDISELELGAGNDEAALPAPSTAHGTAASSSAAQGGAASSSSAAAAAILKAEEPEGNILRTRTYDLYITYDQYYQVPRLWMVGYDESRQPLAANQVLEDVSEEHARKTITVDPHPHLAISAASIHPCRHAETMKRLVDNLRAAGKEFEVTHYLVLFLKFIASVVPTIEYDYTMSVGS